MNMYRCILCAARGTLIRLKLYTATLRAVNLLIRINSKDYFVYCSINLFTIHAVLQTSGNSFYRGN